MNYSTLLTTSRYLFPFFFVCRSITHFVDEFDLPKGSTLLADKRLCLHSTATRKENVFRIINVLDSRGEVK